MDNKKEIIQKGFNPGICSILTIIFVVLKAFGVISFTWFQCFLPLIICGFAYALVLSVIMLVIMFRQD